MEGVIILHETIHELHRKNEWSNLQNRLWKGKILGFGKISGWETLL
jgi:hypothetical protein